MGGMRKRASYVNVSELSGNFYTLSIQPAVSQTAVWTGLQMTTAGGRDGACSAPLKEGARSSPAERTPPGSGDCKVFRTGRTVPERLPYVGPAQRSCVCRAG